MSSIEEKRVYDEQSGTVTALVASDLGVTAVSISDDIVGEFGLVARCTARDVAVTDAGVAVATDDGVLLGDGETFESAGFEPAVAVAGHDGGVLAASEDGRIGRFEDDEWATVGRVDGDVRALDADLVAASDGVHRVTRDGLAAAGLDDARDVASAGVPHAVTPGGLYRLGNGWLDVLDGDFRVVASDAATADPGALGWAHAATGDALYEHAGGVGGRAADTEGDASDEWRERDLPVSEAVADVAYATGAFVAVTDAGTLLVDAGDGIRHRSVGLPGARALAVRSS